MKASEINFWIDAVEQGCPSINKLTPVATKPVKMPNSPMAIYSGVRVPNIMSNPSSASSSDETSVAAWMVSLLLTAATVQVLRANRLLCVCFRGDFAPNE